MSVKILRYLIASVGVWVVILVMMSILGKVKAKKKWEAIIAAVMVVVKLVIRKVEGKKVWNDGCDYSDGRKVWVERLTDGKHESGVGFLWW